MAEFVTRFQLSVWRPAQLGRPLDYVRSESNIDVDDVFDSDLLHEEIYHWHPAQEDPFGGIKDVVLSSQFRNQFVEGFAPSLPPQQRSMERFSEALQKFRDHLLSPDATDWADLMQTISIKGKEPVNLRGNVAVSLLNHMEWILRTFGTMPGASITIR